MIAPTIRDKLARQASFDSVAPPACAVPGVPAALARGADPLTYQDQAMDPAVAHAICSAADPV